MLKNSKIKIVSGEKEIEVSIVQFPTVEGWNVRAQLAKEIKSRLPKNKEGISAIDLVTFISEVLFETKVDLLLNLFKYCAVKDIGAINSTEALDLVFEGDLDAVTELALEVVKFNGFFTTKLISSLADYMPAELKTMVQEQTNKHLKK